MDLEHRPGAGQVETQVSTGDADTLITSWARHLRAANLSPRTVESYTFGARQFASFAAGKGMPTEVAAITREHIETYIEDLLEHWRPSTALTRYRDLQQFFRWLVDEGEIQSSPMERMRPPKLGESSVPVIQPDELAALLRACEGRTLEDRRDLAIVRLFMNTGARLAEVAGITMDDLDLDRGEVRVVRKGRREQWLSLGPKTIRALDRYVRIRAGHRFAGEPWLWLSPKGRLTDSGIAQMVKRRCRDAGIPPINVHRFRHSWAHELKSKGISDDELRTLGGWRSPQMLTRYAASTASERAKATHRRLSPGEDL
jgi:site-specific recombinase XerD